MNSNFAFKSQLIEKLGPKSSFGTYTAMMKEESQYSAVQIDAVESCTALVLPVSKLHSLKSSYKEVDKMVNDVTLFLQEFGIPLCDFKKHNIDANGKKISAKEIF